MLDNKPTKVAPLPEANQLGPKMRALPSDRYRAFVWIYLNNGSNGAGAARDAGFGKGAPRTMAWRLLHRQDVLDAMHECTWRVLARLAGKAATVLESALDSADERIQLKAVDAVFSRTGFIAKTGVVEETRLSSADMVLEIRKAAKQLGVDAQVLLGQAALGQRMLPSGLPAPPVDAEFAEVLEEIEW